MPALRTSIIFSITLASLFANFFNAHSQSLPRFQSSHFSASGDCALCHSSLSDARGADVSIDSHWRSTMMANAARDPYFVAKVSSEIAAHPELRPVLEDVCATCHMPMARTQNKFDGDAAAMFDEGLLNPTNALHTLAMDGVSCAQCHQIQSDNLGEQESFSGGYSIDSETARPDRAIYSQFMNSRVNPMQNLSGFVPQFGEHMRRSEHCAVCHTLFTPYLDENNKIAGEFPEQTVYLEWLQSSYSQNPSQTQDAAQAKACQDCHMPLADGPVATSIIPPFLDAKEPFHQHHFVGGNAFMIQLHQENKEALGINASDEHLSETKRRTLEQLQTKTATVEIQNIGATHDTLSFDALVSVMTGHKYPSAYPSRRAWLHVTVLDGGGAVMFESGKPLGDGRIEGNDADSDAALYEPHHDQITQSSDVQIYEAVMGDTLGDVTYGLLKAAAYLKDNRLLPAGFNQATADDAIQTYGAARDDADFTGGSDRIQCRVNIANADGPFTARVELLHQSVSYPFVRDLQKATTQEIDRFVSMYQKADHAPIMIDESSATGIQKGASILDWQEM